jgi:DNA-binding response OmpR family regulator
MHICTGGEEMEERIIVVDDNPVSTEMLCKFLGKHNIETVVCEDREECLVEVARGNVAIVFIEVVMAGSISGLDVLIAIRKEYNPIELPVIMLTDLRDEKTLAKAIGLGANDFFHKPINCMVAIARIYNQIIASKLYKKSLLEKRSATINSMIATYNHEINNTLSVAFAELYLAQMDNNPTTLNRVSDALKKISAAIRKIERFNSGDIEETEYLMGKKMVRQCIGAKIQA